MSSIEEKICDKLCDLIEYLTYRYELFYLKNLL